MKKRIVEIGEKFGMLTVIALVGSDPRGNQLVRVRCRCPQQTEKTVRLTDLTFEPYHDKRGKLRKPHRSCGCESKSAYLLYLRKYARRLGRRKLRRIWVDRQYGMTFRQLGKKYGIPAAVASAACRIYNQFETEPVCGAIPRGSKAYKEWRDRESSDLPF